jgi:hypothetical protein
MSKLSDELRSRRLRCGLLDEAADALDAMEKALLEIAENGGDRQTVTPETAFAAFSKMNAELIDIRKIARAALARLEGK